MAEGAAPPKDKGPGLMESLGIIKDALPAAGPIMKWLATPNAPPLDAKTIKPEDKERFEKFAALFVGKIPETNGEIKKYLEQPGMIEAARNKAAEKPEMVVDFIQRMPKEQVAKLLKDNPEMMGELKNIVALEMPTMTLASLFNKTVQTGGDVSHILNTNLNDMGNALKRLDTPKEMAEFFAALPPEYAKSFADEFNQTLTEKKFKTRIDPAKIEETVQAALNETYFTTSGYIKGIQDGIQKTVDKFKPENLTPEKAAELVATYSKTDNGKKKLMDLLAEGTPPKLKDKYKEMITPELLANADQSLVHNVLTENLVSGMNSIKNFISGLPPEFQKFIMPLMDMAVGFIEKITPMANQLTSALPGTPGMGTGG